ncbi:hypothetical protein BH24ACT3_BH24ACT3_17190 [soil metagenome]
MVRTALALVLGGGLGLLTGGRLTHAARQRLRWLPLLLCGAAAVAVAGVLAPRGALLVHLLGVLALLAFAGGNVHLVGMSVVVVGLAMNVVPLTFNGGMPVRTDSLVAAGVVAPADVGAVSLRGPRHPAGSGDRLTALGDTVPLRPLGEVVSLGDLVVLIGLADVAFRLSRRRGRHGVSDPATFWKGALRRGAQPAGRGERGRTDGVGPPVHPRGEGWLYDAAFPPPPTTQRRVQRSSSSTASSGTDPSGTSSAMTTTRPVHDWGAAPSPVPSSGSQYSASPDRSAPARARPANNREASRSPAREAANHRREVIWGQAEPRQ